MEQDLQSDAKENTLGTSLDVAVDTNVLDVPNPEKKCFLPCSK